MTTSITITTFTGRVVDLLDPKPDTICLEDIARGLAMQCRFNGHIRRFYSVAEHSVRVSRWLLYQCGPGEILIAQQGLLHDAAEAYVGDLIGPMKALLRLDERRRRGIPDSAFVRPEMTSSFDEAERRLLVAIGARFGVSLMPLQSIVKDADAAMLHQEDDMLRSAAPPRVDDFGWDWATAEDRFLRAAEELGIR